MSSQDSKSFENLLFFVNNGTSFSGEAQPSQLRGRGLAAPPR